MLETATKNAEVNGPPQFQSFSHVSVPCRDLEEGIRFYTQVLGGKVRSQGGSLRVNSYRRNRNRDRNGGLLLRRAWRRVSALRILRGRRRNAANERLADALWRTEHKFLDAMGVEALMFFRDPSNNIIELYCEKGFKGAAELPRGPARGTAGPLISRVSTTTNGGAGLADRLASITPRALSTSSPGLELRTSVAPVTSPLRAGAAVRTSAQPQHRLPPWRRPKPFPRPFPPASRMAPVFSGNP